MKMHVKFVFVGYERSVLNENKKKWKANRAEEYNDFILEDLPDVVREGVGIRLAPFRRDLLTYDLEAVKEALGIFVPKCT